MYKINEEDLSIYVTRGDVVLFDVGANGKDGKPYTFIPGDNVRIKVYKKKKVTDVVLVKEFPITTATQKVQIYLSGNETKFDEPINKPTTYWYEVVLNEDTEPQTIIGYDPDEGAKLFILLPEGATEDDTEDYEPSEDERYMDYAALVKEMAQLEYSFDQTHKAVAELHVTPEMFGAIGDGVSDDTEAFENAVKALTDHSTLRLRGRYLVSKLHIANIDGLTITGGGMILASDSCDFNFIKLNACDNLSVQGIKIDGRNQACRALNLYHLKGFAITDVTIENVGDDTADNSLCGMIFIDAHNGIIVNSTIKSVHAASVATGISFDGDTDEEVPTNVLVDRVRIEDIEPIADADGIKVLGANVYANITVRNSVFVDCAKRALKFQAKGCYSQNNTIYANKCNYASIDFQCGYGKSVDDTIHYNVTEIGVDGNGYIGVGVCSQTEVRGLRVTVANNDASLYSGATSSGMFLVQNLQGEEEVGEITIKDCHIDGCSMLVRNIMSTLVKRITVENVTIGKLYQHGVLNGGNYGHICFKNNALVNRPSGWNSVLNGVTYSTCDMDITNVAAGDTNAMERPTNANSRLAFRCASDSMVSGTYVYEGGRMTFQCPTLVNPQGSIYSSGKHFVMARVGDVAYTSAPTTDGTGFCVGYVCTANPDSTYKCGQWKAIYM